ncbi:calymmin isoform X3 [Synchiropus splendidus]|uniref:calymmin isoform X3 n=1 Tax=Synchiropus splendidus TaxID=270530 RepID=UPI00237EC72C|nr:calymmin isoform X3 [Synchiropus splendidus]
MVQNLSHDHDLFSVPPLKYQKIFYNTCYGATSGVANGLQPNGYGALGGVNNGRIKGYGGAGAMNKGQGRKPQGYGRQAGTTNGQQTKGNGFGAQGGALGGPATKGNGYGVPTAALGAIGNRGNKGQMNNGFGTRTGILGGNGAKPNGQKSSASGVNGAQPNGAGGKSMKGYGNPSYGAGAGLGMGASRGMGVPQLASNQGKAFGGNGYGARPMAGYNGGTGFGLGPQAGNGGMKGPKQGYQAAAGASNGQSANGFGFAAASRPTKPMFGNMPNGYGGKPTGYNAARGAYGAGALPTGYGPKPNGYGAKPYGQGGKYGAALGGVGGKPNGYSGANRGMQTQVTKGAGAVSPGEGSKTLGAGFGGMPQGQGTNGADMYNGKGFKGGVQSPQQPSFATVQGAAQQGFPQGKGYQQPQLIPQATAAPAAMFPTGPTPQPALTALQGMGLKESTSGPVVPYVDPASEPVTHPQGHGKGSGMTKGQGVNPDCGPSGIPNGQWMKIPRPAHNGAAGAPMGANTKGFGAGTGAPNVFGAKSNGNGAGGYPGLNNGYGAGLGYPYGGKPNQPTFGQGIYPGAGYGNPYGGNAGMGEPVKSKSGFGNGYGVQPDYASLGPNTPSANGKSGMGQFGPGGMSGNKYGGMGLTGKGQASNGKYGIGGLQFGGAAPTGNNLAAKSGDGAGAFNPAHGAKSSGKYGGASMGGSPAMGQYNQWFGGFPNGGQLLGLGSEVNRPGKYGYGQLPAEAQGAAQLPQGKYGAAQGGSQFQSESVGFIQQGKSSSSYGAEAPYVSQSQGFDGAKSRGKYGAVPSLASAVEADGTLARQYEDAGYMNGKMQPDAAAFPAAPTPSTLYSHPSAASYLPAESAFTPDVVPGAGAVDLADLSRTLGTATAAETLSAAQDSEQPDDQQELPRQIHIQQHLKLHFHPQGAKDEKYDLNSFLGNSGYQG